MAVVLSAISPRTPCDLFAAMALSPTLAAGAPASIPALHFFPPTPDTPDHPSPLQEEPVEPPGPTHRPLATNEAKQLSLLLTQHLFPVRHSPKGLMSESISLAEKLHEAGVRWDKKRRVMGMHLRGIWEEGQRLGNVKTIGGHGPMDLYVQGSFLSIAEEPHPLDPMPIPIEVHPASFAALPKLTLQAGLANSLPGVTAQLEHAYPIVKAYRPYDLDLPSPGHTPGPVKRLAMDHGIVPRRGWRERKKAGLKIKVEGPMVRRGIRAVVDTPRTAHTAILLSSRKSTFAQFLPRQRTNWWNMVSMGKRRAKVLHVVPNTAGGVKSARRVSFVGYEVR